MDILGFTIGMMVYGFIVGLIIGIGACCYAFISIRYEKRRKVKYSQIVTRRNVTRPMTTSG